MTDPIADMIIRIKNSVMAGRKDLLVPYSKVKESLARIMQEFAYISAYEVQDDGKFKQIKITLRYVGKSPAITGVKRISKPGCRIYKNADAIPNTLNGYGLTVLSTNKGIMDGKSARKNHVGGEVLFQIW